MRPWSAWSEERKKKRAEQREQKELWKAGILRTPGDGCALSRQEFKVLEYLQQKVPALQDFEALHMALDIVRITATELAMGALLSEDKPTPTAALDCVCDVPNMYITPLGLFACRKCMRFIP